RGRGAWGSRAEGAGLLLSSLDPWGLRPLDPFPMLGSLSPQQFLAQHWQKRPLLIRGALPGFQSGLSADELAGLACEDDIESRLVQGKVGERWQLEHGPFAPERLERLPERDWTLLVQDVDKWVP